MKRPVGVILSAILLLFGSIVMAMFVVLMIIGMVAISAKMGQLGPSGAPGMPSQGYLIAVFLSEALVVLALAAWGFITFVGLLRMRSWARISMIVIGGGQALMAAMCALIFLAMTFIPLPMPETPSGQQTGMTLKIVFAVFAIISALHAALGGWWIYYFLRKATVEAFAVVPGAVLAKSRRPLPVAIIAVIKLMSAVFCLLACAMPTPAVLFGAVVDGWGKVLLYLVMTMVIVATGVGLWRLREWGRWLAFGLAAWSVFYAGYIVLFPEAMERAQQIAQMKMGTPASVVFTAGMMRPIMGLGMGFAVLWWALIVAVLIYYRRAFQSGPDESPVDLAGIPEVTQGE